mmetsp:Transcript_106748/g.300045  ORF Transcript_106748/g.300045 Transcript_106748/m.300045 type:complete len:554 (-) Transcript_106748:200-1861(-)|eukprot:CAMPEP_0117505290 /NCGR_PEP_ID=MMETSP0784-20121206/25300_1 /TAXON_ID=39447 /ORGANISM="" /LENGTH=553 /DNA_ID=CAMNT_0005300695 /DNA_START=81 /DNA_END=1742 /DNA_ORIENTATION=+
MAAGATKDHIDDFFDDLLAEPLFDEPNVARGITAATVPRGAVAESAGDNHIGSAVAGVSLHTEATEAAPIDNTVGAQMGYAGIGSVLGAAFDEQEQRKSTPPTTSDDGCTLDSKAGDQHIQRDGAKDGERSGAKFPSWASSLKKKTKLLGMAARKVLAEEVQVVVDEARDLAEGVREGISLTAQDAKALREKVARDANNANSAKPKDCAADASCPRVPSDPLLAAVTFDAIGDSGSKEATGCGRHGTFEAIRQGFVVTAGVSRDMWKDLKEVNQDVVTDLRQNFGDVRTGLHGLRTAWRGAQPNVGVPTEAPVDSGDDLRSDDAAVAVSTAPEAVDAKLIQQLPAATRVIDDDSSDPSSFVGRRCDEQAAQAPQRRVNAVAQVTGELWRKMPAATGFVQNFQVAAATSSTAEVGICENEGGHKAFWQLPSARGNYVELAGFSDVVNESMSVTTAPPLADSGGAGAAVHRVRKLGGKLAKSSFRQAAEVSTGLMRQALDLGQNIQAGAVGVVRPGGSSSTCAVACIDGESLADDVFEIGSDSDGDDNMKQAEDT